MGNSITISVYFMWEWWEKYYHINVPRPEKPGDQQLADMYLDRKKFLFNNFGSLGIGEENPIMDGKYVNMVMKWGMDFVPFAFGAELKCQDVGGYAIKNMSYEEIEKLKPVDFYNNPAGDWILKRKDKLIKLYGTAENGMDIEGPVNTAVRLRGEEFYIDLLENQAFAANLLDVITQTMINGYKFFIKEFDAKGFTVANCNVTLMSPSMYNNTSIEYDIKLAKFAQNHTGGNSFSIHHCDVPIDGFIEYYKKIPGVSRVEASHKSDIRRFRKEIPSAMFAAMVSPHEIMCKADKLFEEEINNAIISGAGELDIWNIDPTVSPLDLERILKMISKCCEINGYIADFQVIPFCWDELEWAFPRY